MTLSRRDALALGLGAPLVLTLLRAPAAASPETMKAAIDAFTGGVAPTEGRVTLDIPVLVENGNSVPMTVTVESQMMPEDHVTEIAVFNELNPLPEIVTARLTPAMGKARLQTRIRLGDTQTITAIARMSDGSLWSAAMTVIVTAPACLES
jgi:sulfur-oxidizing protein SoxY